MNKNCALKLVNEIILYYDARSKKHQIKGTGHLKAVVTASEALIYIEYCIEFLLNI